MLFRQDGEAVLAIPQPSHAWLAGQIVRAWGNTDFARPHPYEGVCLGAELHDIGWLRWEAEPTLNPGTGMPHEFRELDLETRIADWEHGVRLALAFGHYPALLVSLHANTIYGHLEEEAAQRFLDRQKRFQGEVLETLARTRGDEIGSAVLAERNRLMIRAADHLSLMICWGVREEKRVPEVPHGADATTDLRIAPVDGRVDRLVLDPWPFADDMVELICEARRLAGRFTDETEMRTALAAKDAPELLLTRLVPR